VSAGYITLLGGQRLSPRIRDRMCAPSQNDFRSLLYREFIGSVTPGGTNAFVVSDPVPDGFYWWITALSGYNNDGAVRTVNLYVVPSQFNPLDPAFFQGAVQSGPTQGSIRIDKGGMGNPQSINFTQVDQANVPFALPSGWRAMAWEQSNATPPVGAHTFGIRLAFFQVLNGYKAPGM
jgi:FtsP/CotA-like multicopper oxidase with cupredoxin domain